MEVKPLRQSSVPAGYKQTEVGVIPEDWECVESIAMATYFGGNAFKSEAAVSVGIRWLKIANVGKQQAQWKDISYLPNYYATDFRDYMLRVGDVVMALTRPILNNELKIAKLAEHDVPALLNQRVAKVIARPEADLDFIYHVLQTRHFVDSMNDAMAGTDPPNIGSRALGRIPIATPPSIEEQRAIAEVLNDADALIESIEHLIAKKRQLKKGAMQELLTGKKRLPGFRTKLGYKQTEVGMIPEDWDTPELGAILKSRQLGGNYKNSERETSWPLIKMGNIGRGSIKIEKREFIDSTQPPALRDRLRKYDVLFNTRNTLDLVGKAAIWRDELPEAYFNSNIMRMEFDEARVSSKRFMNYILNTPQSIKGLRGIAIGTTSVAAIYGRDLVKVTVPLPTKPEQEAIASILSDMDAEIVALEAKLTKARQLKQGMMQELLTGRIRLI